MLPVIEADSTDAPEILEVWRAADAAPTITDDIAAIEAVIDAHYAWLLVIREHTRIVGTIIGAWEGWRGSLYRLAVLPTHRRRGIATTLVCAAEHHLAAAGARRLSLVVVANEHAATAFWAALGCIAQPDRVRHVRDLDPS